MKVRELAKLLEWYIELSCDDFEVNCLTRSGRPSMARLRGVAATDDVRMGTFHCLRPEGDEDNPTTCLDRQEWDMCTACALRSSVVDGPPAVWMVASEDFPYPAHWQEPWAEHVSPLLWTASSGQDDSLAGTS